jgi:hypothetical protein
MQLDQQRAGWICLSCIWKMHAGQSPRAASPAELGRAGSGTTGGSTEQSLLQHPPSMDAQRLHTRRTQSYSGTPSPADVSTSHDRRPCRQPEGNCIRFAQQSAWASVWPAFDGRPDTTDLQRIRGAEGKKKELPHDHPQTLSPSGFSMQSSFSRSLAVRHDVC